MAKPLIYGNMLLCICHTIHSKRLHHQFVHILMFKNSLDSAFSRMHLHTQAAEKRISTTSICATIYLHHTFGAAFKPTKWYVIIESITDLALDMPITLYGPIRACVHHEQKVQTFRHQTCSHQRLHL